VKEVIVVKEIHCSEKGHFNVVTYVFFKGISFSPDKTMVTMFETARKKRAREPKPFSIWQRAKVQRRDEISGSQTHEETYMDMAH